VPMIHHWTRLETIANHSCGANGKAQKNGQPAFRKGRPITYEF
jgi:hypothetical protein